MEFNVNCCRIASQILDLGFTKIRPEKTQAGTRDTGPKIRDVPGNTGRLATLYQGQSNKTRQHAENFYTSYPAHKNWNNKSVIPTLFNYYSALQSTFLVKQVATSLIHCYTSTKLALGDTYISGGVGR